MMYQVEQLAINKLDIGCNIQNSVTKSLSLIELLIFSEVQRLNIHTEENCNMPFYKAIRQKPHIIKECRIS